jgi:hypothetical protein
MSHGRESSAAESSSSSVLRVGLSLLQLLLFMVCVGVGGSYLERRQKQQAAAEAAEARRKREYAKAMADDSEEDGEQLGLVAPCEHDTDSDAQDVRRQLERLRLGRYADAFLEHGYDYWPEILRLPHSRLAVLVEVTGMAVNHGHRLREQLAAQREAMGIRQAGPSA